VRNALPWHVCLRAVGPQPGDRCSSPATAWGRKAPVTTPSCPDGPWIFGSELKALLVSSGAARGVIDPLAVEDYFAYGYVPETAHHLQEPCSSFPPPGHTLSLKRGGRGIRTGRILGCAVSSRFPAPS